MLSLLRPALSLVLAFTILLGVAYPLTVTAVANAALAQQAQGSLIRDGHGRLVGSRLIAQSFTSARYLHARGSGAGNGYDATSSGGTNLGPLDPKLAARIAKEAQGLRAEAPGVPIPADAVTWSGSGLDPDISPQYAALQAPRIASARGAPLARVKAIIARHTTSPALGVFGEAHVNVLEANLDLDRL